MAAGQLEKKRVCSALSRAIKLSAPVCADGPLLGPPQRSQFAANVLPIIGDTS